MGIEGQEATFWETGKGNGISVNLSCFRTTPDVSTDEKDDTRKEKAGLVYFLQ